jgi:D-tyrosyl-tRNA(Tyr) deacylase
MPGGNLTFGAPEPTAEPITPRGGPSNRRSAILGGAVSRAVSEAGMRAVVQRVSESSVAVGSEQIARIGRGLLVLLGVGVSDTTREADALAEKIAHLRIFEDAGGKLNRSIVETGGELLVVSQFTLLGDCRGGRRPSFTAAAPAEQAAALYAHFVSAAARFGIPVKTGRFRAQMAVSLVNDGPVTLILDCP